MGLHSAKEARALFRTTFAELSPEEVGNYQAGKTLSAPDRFDEFLLKMNDVARRAQAPSARWLWCTVGVPLVFDEPRFTTVLPASQLGRLLKFYASKQDKLRFSRHGIDYGGQVPEEIWAADMATLPEAELFFRVNMQVRQSHFSGLLWITPTSYFKLLTSGTPASGVADDVRDRLGLIHRKAGDWLVALHYPATVLSTVRSARPTFVEANTHSRFKTRTSGEVRPTDATWGRTLMLDRFAKSGTLLSGAEERVISQFGNDKIGPHLTVEFDVLGAILRDRGDTSVDDDFAYANRLTRRYKSATLRRAVDA